MKRPSNDTIVQAANALAEIVPEGEVADIRQRLIAAGVRREAYQSGATTLPMTILGQIFGAMITAGATPEQAKRWLLKGYGYPGFPELRATPDATAQLCRFLAFARGEVEQLCRPGCAESALEALADGMIPFFERVMDAMPE